MNEESAHDTKEFLSKRLTAIKSQISSGELEDLALIIGQCKMFTTTLSHPQCETDGKSLGFALDKEISKTFLELAIMCKAVICCLSLISPFHLSPQNFYQAVSRPSRRHSSSNLSRRTRRLSYSRLVMVLTMSV